jgi:hypothetical protein
MAIAQLFERPTSMSNDIRSILDRLATVEGRLSPAQQRVPQLPALFKPRHIRALGAKTDPAHPMDGYMVGDSIEPQRTALEEAMAEIEEDMLSKVKKDLTQYLDRLEKKVAVSRDLKDKAVDAVRKGKAEEDLDELDYSAASGATAQPSVTQQAQTAGNAIKKYMPAATKFAANTVRQMKGQDPTKDPSYAKLSPSQQQQYVQAQKTIDATDADELEKFDANQAAANVQGMAKSVVNPANMPDVNLKSNVVDRKTAADYAPATVDGKPATPAATFEMADGVALECWGDDNQGYELRRGERALPSRFKNLDHAGMAVKLYQARRRQQQPEQDLSQDYIEER